MFMTKNKAMEIMGINRLDLSYQGIDSFPCKSAKICFYFVRNGGDNGKDQEHMAQIFGLLEKRKRGASDYICRSYIISTEKDDWMRDMWHEVIELIEAIRVSNDFTEHNS